MRQRLAPTSKARTNIPERQLSHFFFFGAMSQPRRLAVLWPDPVPIALDCNSDSIVSLTVTCEVCGERDPSIAHVPCCSVAAHQHCPNDGLDALIVVRTCGHCSNRRTRAPVFLTRRTPASVLCCFQRACGLQLPSGGGTTSGELCGLHGTHDGREH